MDITTLGYYIAIIPVSILALVAGGCLLWVFTEMIKCTIEAYKEKSLAGLIMFSLVWMGLIGIALIVIGDLT